LVENNDNECQEPEHTDDSTKINIDDVNEIIKVGKHTISYDKYKCLLKQCPQYKELLKQIQALKTEIEHHRREINKYKRIETTLFIVECIIACILMYIHIVYKI